MKCLWVWVATDHPDMLQYRLPLFVFWLLLLQSVLGNDPSAPEQTISYVLYPCFLNFWFTLIITIFVSAIRVTDIKQAQEALEVRYFLPNVMKYYNSLGKENLQWHGERMSLNKIAFFHCYFHCLLPWSQGKGLYEEKKKRHNMGLEALGGSEVSQIPQCRTCNKTLQAKFRVWGHETWITPCQPETPAVILMHYLYFLPLNITLGICLWIVCWVHFQMKGSISKVTEREVVCHAEISPSLYVFTTTYRFADLPELVLKLFKCTCSFTAWPCERRECLPSPL